MTSCFFFKQKTAYEMRISDWSSDVCSSDLPSMASIIDVGGGASTLVDDLLANGYRNLTVLDLSAAALATAKTRLGSNAASVRWLEANVIEAALPERSFDVWHDRAVFHFLTSEEDRDRKSTRLNSSH